MKENCLTLVLLKRLTEKYPNFLNKVDAFAGTSTGGIIALGLAHGVPIDKLIDLYQNRGKDIFHDSLLDDVGDLFGLAGANYSQDKLKEICWGLFGNYTLGDLKKKVLVTSFCLDNKKNGNDRSWGPAIYDNFDDKYKDERLWELCLKTSAAPTFFPTHKNFIDGGVIANCPSVCILADIYKAGYKDGDIKMISFGMGKTIKYIEGENLDWGIVKYAPYLIDILMDGTAKLADYQTKQLLEDNYLRINPQTPKEFKLDGIKEIPEMVNFAQNYNFTKEEIDFIEKVW